MYLGSPPPSPPSSAASFCAFARNTIHTSLDTAQVLLSFQSLFVCAFLFFGLAFFLLLWNIVAGPDEDDDDDEREPDADAGMYHHYAQDRHGRWVAVPVLVLPHRGSSRSRSHSRTSSSSSSRRKYDGKHTPQRRQ
ncbi:hypothetical protein MKEN_00489500 [Mycena kentingensis (nom. inval.)]|nr:hypothetical protein MKEN_00489500 [Mycena kentingensis (nom. inval.)]